MKIAWFTPFTEKSAIGKYSQIATNYLSENCEVDLWLSEKENLHKSSLKKVYYSLGDDLQKILEVYYHCIFNMGDYLYFHLDLYDIYYRYGGILILHDFIMHDFFYGYDMVHLKDRDRYLREMSKYYGEDGRDAALKVLSGIPLSTANNFDEVMKYPFFERTLQQAEGVIVHSHFLGNAVKNYYNGPCKVIYFPFKLEDMFNDVTSVSKEDVGYNEDDILMLTVGNVNYNKRVDKVIEVIGRNKKQLKNLKYVIIGGCGQADLRKKIDELILEYDLSEQVDMMGYQDDEVLNRFLKVADISMNLRVPAMEGASWSLVEQLAFGKAIIVADNGFYSEIPSDCILKVRIEHEEEDTIRAIKKLVNNREEIVNYGTNAQKYSEREFEPNKYCNKLVAFVNQIKERDYLYRFTDSLSYQMNEMGIKSSSNLVSEMADIICELFVEKKNV